MLRSWQVSNFKSIGTPASQLELGAITIFAGANSSGKSSVIQSLLLIVQTLAGENDTALRLNGDLVSLGTAQDVWHNGKTVEPLRVAFTLDTSSGEHRGYYDLTFCPDPTGHSDTTVALSKGLYFWGSPHDDYEYQLNVELDPRSLRYHLTDVSPLVQSAAEQQLQAVGLTNISPLKGTGVWLRCFLPTEVWIEAARTRTSMNWDIALVEPLPIRQFTDKDLDLNIPEDQASVIQEAIQELALPALGYSRPTQPDQRNLAAPLTLRTYCEWFGWLPTAKTDELRRYYRSHLKNLTESARQWHSLAVTRALERNAHEFFTTRIRYLGANRIGPTALFELSDASRWSEVGITGNKVASALEKFRDRPVTYWHPDQWTLREDTLLHAVEAWLQYFDLIERVGTVDYGKLGTFLRIHTGGVDKDLDLTAVGFGTSQVLPIIVQGLLTPRNGLFIVEQPEVHLHPRIQSQLACFFFGLMQAGVQCVVETHSEYIVNQLRLLAADRRHKNLHHQVRIYFANRSPEHGTRLDPIRLKRNGTIDNWPPGFMDESNRLAKDLLATALESS